MERIWDQRRYPRRLFPHQIGVLCRGVYSIESGGDLGEGGIGFRSDLVYPQGGQVVISFQIPGGAIAILVAHVVFVKREESGKMFHGCTFATIQFERKREIRSFVSAR